MKGKIKLRETILKEGKELEISFTRMDSLLCRCCQQLPEKYLRNLDGLKKTLLRLSRSLPFPLIILSGYRCPKYNAEVGGERYSPHLKGLAADLLVANPKDRFLLIKQLILVGIPRIRLYQNLPSVLHFDLDPNQPRPLFAIQKEEGEDV